MFKEFMDKYLGKALDVDGAYGPQCTDLFNAWNRDYNNVYINCAPTGYARSLAENKYNNNLLKYFKETEVNNMVEGTVVVYGICDFAPAGHVCFFIKDNGNGTYQALNQNYNDQQWVTINDNPYDGIIGAFIPNQIVEERKEGEREQDSVIIQKEKTIDELVQEVKNGVYGNGEDRKRALGSRYNEVQTRLNESVALETNNPIETVYVVRNGDTLSEIAKIYNTTVSHLVEVNKIGNPNLITPGQKIIIK